MGRKIKITDMYPIQVKGGGKIINITGSETVGATTSGGPSGDGMLFEDGGFMLHEDGNYMVYE